MILESFANETVADLTCNEVEMLKYRRCWRQVVIVHLCYWQAEVFHLVIARIETRKHGIMVVYPSLHIVFDIEVHHA